MKQNFILKLVHLILLFIIINFHTYSQIWSETSGLAGSARSIVHTNSNSFAISGNLIFRSADDGNSWDRLPIYFSQVVNDLAVCSNSILRADDNGLFRSTDEGLTWTQSALQTGPCFSISVNGLSAYSIGSSGLFRTIDGGVNWNRVYIPRLGTFTRVALEGNLVVVSDQFELFISSNSGVSFSTISQPNVIPYLVNGNRILARTSLGHSYSTDTGNTWNLMPDIPSNAGVYDVCVDGSKVFFATTLGVYVSPDNGNTWTLINDKSSNAIDSNNGTILLGSEYLLRSTNGGSTWQYSASGLNTGYAGPIMLDSSGLFAGGDGVFYSPDEGTNWEPRIEGISGNVNQLEKLGNYIFATTQNGVFRSSDNGLTWTTTNTGLIDLDLNQILVFDSLVFVSNRSPVFPNFYVSSDSGITWIPDTIFGAASISSMIRKGNDIYITTYGTGIFKSSDAGQSWNPLISSPVPSSREIISHQNMLVVSGEGVSEIYYSQDDGATWDSMTTVWSEDFSVIYDMISIGNYLVVSTWYDKGIFISNDMGLTWRNVTADLAPQSYVGGVNFCYDGNYIYVSIPFGGIWSTTLTLLSTIDVDEYDLDSFVLYPNPIIEVVTIQSKLFTSLNGIQLFDLAGKEIIANLDYNFDPEGNEIKINVESLVSGIYFIRISTELGTLATKIIKSE
jgi:photosystem II stability/assembly factor-like uncharacterized protein